MCSLGWLKGVWLRGKAQTQHAFQRPDKTRIASPEPLDRVELPTSTPTDTPNAALATDTTSEHTESVPEPEKRPPSPLKSIMPQSEHVELLPPPEIHLEDEPLPLPGMRNLSRNSVSSFFANFVG